MFETFKLVLLLRGQKALSDGEIYSEWPLVNLSEHIRSFVPNLKGWVVQQYQNQTSSSTKEQH